MHIVLPLSWIPAIRVALKYKRKVVRPAVVTGLFILGQLCLLSKTTGAAPDAEIVDSASSQEKALSSVPGETAEQRDERVKWWRDARFGMFIHWGIYAIPGKGEWVQWREQIPPSEYAKLADQFTAEKFDASEWAAVAKAGGMKYVVLTSRHHDGFALFDSRINQFNSMNSAAKRDFVAEHTKAVRNAGLGVGLYYSPMDWRYPGFLLPNYFTDSSEAMKKQFHEEMAQIGSNYGKLDILWYDGGQNSWLGFGGLEHIPRKGWIRRATDVPYQGKYTWDSDKVNAALREKHPDILINERTDAPGDFDTREGDSRMGSFDNTKPWELCTTLAGNWGWTRGAKPKSLEQCIRLLVNAVGRDGNLLLNVGPRADGTIEPDQVERLKEIGQWLSKYGESIYGTRGGPFLPGKYGVSTRKGKTIYLHLLDAGIETIQLPAISAEVVGSGVLGGGKVMMSQTANGIEVTVPKSEQQPINTIVVLELDTPAAGIEPLNVD